MAVAASHHLYDVRSSHPRVSTTSKPSSFHERGKYSLSPPPTAPLMALPTAYQSLKQKSGLYMGCFPERASYKSHVLRE
jgi:hypothetical protein